MDGKVKPKRIGKIGNYYGGLYIAEHNGKYFWGVENHSSSLSWIADEAWYEIEKSLYDALLAHKPKKQKP